MRIAVPTEIKNNEFRIAITPVGVHELTRRGHEVYVQAGAGAGSSFTDEEFTAQGARIVEGAGNLRELVRATISSVLDRGLRARKRIFFG